MKKRLTALFVFIMLISGTAFCYGENEMEFKEGHIFVSFPESWDVIAEPEEKGTLKEDKKTEAAKMESVLKGTGFSWQEILKLFFEEDMIFFASKGSKTHKIWLQLKYLRVPEMREPVAKRPYQYEEPELKAFHEIYGDAVIETLTGNSDRDLVIDESIYQSDISCYVKLTLKNEDQGKKDVVYYKPKEGSIITFIASGSKEVLTETQISKLEDGIINYFADYGYYEPLPVETYEKTTANHGYDIVLIFLLSIVIAAIAFFTYRIINAMNENNCTGVDAILLAVQQVFNDIKEKWTHSSNHTLANERQRERKRNSLPAQEKKERNPAARYRESMQSLLDTGLLTQEEYDEMIKKRNDKKQL